MSTHGFNLHVFTTWGKSNIYTARGLCGRKIQLNTETAVLKTPYTTSAGKVAYVDYITTKLFPHQPVINQGLYKKGERIPNNVNCQSIPGDYFMEPNVCIECITSMSELLAEGPAAVNISPNSGETLPVKKKRASRNKPWK